MKYYVYILFSKRNGTLYCGVTNDLKRRMYEHKNKFYKGFSCTYDVNKLGYFEEYSDIKLAIEREKQLKAGNRKMKLRLIERMNSEWKDLFEVL